MVDMYPDTEPKILYYDVRLVYPESWVNDGLSDNWIIVYYWSNGSVTWNYKDEQRKGYTDIN